MTEGRETIILMADDDPAQLMLAEAALAGAGFMVHSAADGAAVVERFDEVHPDIVLLDVNMPRMSGIDACRAIRERVGSKSLPILMLTGRNDLAAISDAFAAGASDFAQKGLNPRLLVERVRFLLRDRALQEELRSSRSKLLLAQRVARVGHWELGCDGRSLNVSPVLGEILAVDPASLRSFEDFVRMLDRSEHFAARQAFLACAAGEGRCSSDHRLTTASGEELWIHQEAERVDQDGQPHESTVVVTLQDLTRLRRAEEQARFLSYYDSATGLPNRRYLIEQTVAASAEGAGVAAAGIAAFRIHNLDSIAQSQGIEAAHAMLGRLAKLIEIALENVSEGGMVPWRSASPAVCRTAEAELSLLLRSRESAQHLFEVAATMLRTLAAEMPDDLLDFRPAIGAGVAEIKEGPAGGEQAMLQAHAAAEQAVEPWACDVYSPESQARSRRRLQLESLLRGAVERGEISLVYQPRVTVDGGVLTGVECLARWENSQVGRVEPREFVPVAERAGLIEQIGEWVLGEACRQLAVWRKHFQLEFRVSVNVSARQLRDPTLPGTISRLLASHGLPGTALELELTESTAIESAADVRATLQKLRSLGIRVAIDDLGIGLASLTQLRRLTLDTMKLGRLLIGELYTDLGAQGVVTAVIAMARSMQVRSVAMGVTDWETLDMLAALGCDEVQGQYISLPLGARDFETWLDDGGAASRFRGGRVDLIDAVEAIERRSR